MKFTDKYEILELLTTGRVSTFHARERKTQEQVIVHSFDYAGAVSSSPDRASVMARFASLAPSPSSVTIETGFDEISSSAFVVTRLPLASELQEWIRAYRAFPQGRQPLAAKPGDATSEISASEIDSMLAQSAGTKPREPVRGAGEISGPISVPTGKGVADQGGGEFTQLFRELGAFQPLGGPAPAGASGKNNAEPNIPTAQFTLSTPRDRGNFGPDTTPQEPVNPASTRPGSFTEQFFSAAKPNPSSVAAGKNSPAPSEPAPSPPGAFTQEFILGGQSASEASRPSPAIPRASEPPRTAASFNPTGFDAMFRPEPSMGSGDALGSPEKPSDGVGEFTSFFGGPFDRPAPLGKPISVPDPVEVRNPASHAGEFTQMFGSEDVARASSSKSAVEPEATSAPGAFTQIFGGDSERGTKLGSSTLGASSTGSMQPPPPKASTPTPAPIVSLPEKAPVVPPPLPSQFPVSSTTNVPSSVSQSPFAKRSGSADATDIFRVRGEEPPPAQDLPAGPSEFTQFLNRSQVAAALPAEPPTAPPPAAPAFQFAPPPPPAPPPIPKPAIKAPKLPAIPPPAVAPPSAGTLWPLITVLTILVAIGALLVMYFALKH